MGKVKRVQYVKLIIGMLAKNQKFFNLIESFLIKEFGQIDYKSPILPFYHTDYYNRELGYPLKREFISFKKSISPEYIAKAKVITNSLEKKFSEQKNGSVKRRINIDPGYISDSKLILATTKDYFHRIYLNKGIYAEVTLRWRKDSFQPFEWTYPDYKTAEYITILAAIRNNYIQKKKNRAG